MPKKIKKKVIKQKQKQVQRQSVKININQPVKRVYKRRSASDTQNKQLPYYIPNQPIVNVTIPNLERTIQQGFESIGYKLNEPIKDKFAVKESETQTNIPIFDTEQKEKPTKIPKLKKPKLVIEEPDVIDIEQQTDISVPAQVPEILPKKPRVRIEPTIPELKARYIELTGDKEGAKGINKSNKQKIIEVINRMEETGKVQKL